MKKYRSIILLPLILLLAFIFISVNCKRESADSEEKTLSTELISAEYVGRDNCIECHELQHELFMGSDHDQAMQPATEEYVLGDFNESGFTHFGVTSRFYTKDGKYFVYTQGPEGVMQEYEISYTFGVRPLQQYLIEFPGGRYQCLPICWDTRPAEQGGQKWFHVYGDEHIPPEDVLFWTKVNQNWNYMCAECHSTNLRKNYDYQSRTYNTTWSEVDVSCEACHGPGSEHIKWAEIVEKGGNPETFADMGLVIRLKDRDNAVWVFDPDSTTARRSVPRENDVVVQMCSRCHSRRSVLTEDYFHGGSLLNTHWPSLLEEGLYFADGQILEEVYVYASFLQSKMYQAGVSCKDCHEPHSGKIYVQGNALCYRCHMASEYGTREHHFHDPEQEGASCYECHMHERTYMQNDPRRDHSIRNPRPDLSGELGTPNACNQCHNDKSIEWATRYLREWYGNDITDRYHYGESFHAAREGRPGTEDELIALAVNKENAPMIRATAVMLMSNYPGEKRTQLINQTLKDKYPVVRYASINALVNSPSENILNLILPGLKDSIKLVRIMAAYNLAGIPEDQIPVEYKQAYNQCMDEYRESLMINTDHPNTHINLGNIHLREGDLQEAEQSYLEAIELGPELFTPYINLADLYRRENRDDEGEKILNKALENHPEMAPIHYALGLLKVREGDNETATEYLRQAALLAPDDPHYSYVYGIALNSMKKPQEAINFLESALQRHPWDREILFILTTLNFEQGNIQKSRDYARQLSEYYPEDPEVQQLMNSLGR
ncbi:MAG: tetratricopeptide repeat protein [Bacteroidales bacterium]